MKTLSQAGLDALVKKTAAKKSIYGAVFQVAAPARNLLLTSAAGNLLPNSPYYIASINKFFLSALTLRLYRDGRLHLQEKLNDHLPESYRKGLLVYKGRDYTAEITLAHLLSQTSGLPCYLLDKSSASGPLLNTLHGGKDEAWPLEKVIEQVKQTGGRFRPGSAGKAYYGNTNFRLLGRVLENVLQKPLPHILTGFFEELGMAHTYVVRPGDKKAPAPVYIQKTPVWLPRYFSSTGYDVVSTAPDQMRFLQAFFGGYFYPQERLQELEQWTPVFFPFQYGIGLQKFTIPRWLSPFRPVPAIIGHCGSAGTVAFYIPAKGVFVTGTVNQARAPRVAFQTLLQIINRL